MSLLTELGIHAERKLQICRAYGASRLENESGNDLPKKRKTKKHTAEMLQQKRNIQIGFSSYSNKKTSFVESPE
jgi:hypothetical protein